MLLAGIDFLEDRAAFILKFCIKYTTKYGSVEIIARAHV
jgi:hypothetical protein